MAEFGVACGPSMSLAGSTNEAGVLVCNNAAAASLRSSRPKPIAAMACTRTEGSFSPSKKGSAGTFSR
ncbi:hypothetical protein D3C85_1637770 [compost metagenome]